MAQSLPRAVIQSTPEGATSAGERITAATVQDPVEMNNFQEDMLLCTICQFRMEDPKDLDCRHSFCKCCLNELLIFSEDGMFHS